MSKKSPGIRCTECGSYYDRQDGQCDCKTNPDIMPSTRHQIVEHNKVMMKTAYSNNRRINQAYLNFDFK